MTTESELLARIEQVEQELREWKGNPIVVARCFRVVDGEGEVMAQLADDAEGGITFRMGKSAGEAPILLHVPPSGTPLIGICTSDGTYTAGLFLRDSGLPSFQLRDRDGAVRASIGIDPDESVSICLAGRSGQAGFTARVEVDGTASVRTTDEETGDTAGLSIPVVEGTPRFDQEEVKFPFGLGPRLLAPGLTSDALRREAASGNPRALHDLALDTWDRAHRERGGIYPDGDLLREAVGCFRKAADAKLGEAMYALGVIECTVVGMKDVKDALEWFKKAAAVGHDQARRAAQWVATNYRIFADKVRK